jgi:hypothetical protein
MKIVVTTLLSLLITILSFAQTEDNDMQFGFGVSLSNEYSVYIFNGYGEEQLQVEALPIDMANISLIIKNNFFRFEPSFGYFTTSRDHSEGGSSSENSTTNIRLGAVIALNNNNIESMNLYYGIDIGLILNTNSYSYNSIYSNESNDQSKTDFFVGAAVGGEYMFIKYFSLGGEINLNYISFGQYDSGSGTSVWAMSTRGAIYLRWYLN